MPARSAHSSSGIAAEPVELNHKDLPPQIIELFLAVVIGMRFGGRVGHTPCMHVVYSEAFTA